MLDSGAVGVTVVDGSSGGWGEGLLLLWLVAKYSQRFLYVILRSGTKKPSERSLTPHGRSPKVFRKREEINRFGKWDFTCYTDLASPTNRGKKSIDLENGILLATPIWRRRAIDTSVRIRTGLQNRTLPTTSTPRLSSHTGGCSTLLSCQQYGISSTQQCQLLE